MNPQVSWIILISDHYQKSLHFYSKTLGFPIEKEISEEEFCQFKLSNCTLAIYGRKQIEKLIVKEYLGTPGGANYSLPDSVDIDVDYQSLQKKGVTFLKEPSTRPWGQRTAYFTDPDGHIWELQQWINK